MVAHEHAYDWSSQIGWLAESLQSAASAGRIVSERGGDERTARWVGKTNRDGARDAFGAGVALPGVDDGAVPGAAGAGAAAGGGVAAGAGAGAGAGPDGAIGVDAGAQVGGLGGSPAG